MTLEYENRGGEKSSISWQNIANHPECFHLLLYGVKKRVQSILVRLIPCPRAEVAATR